MASGASSETSAASGLTHVVAVDGSEGARRAFDTAVGMFHRGDKLIVVHIGDASKDYLPFDQRPSSIEAAFSTRCTPLLPPGAWRVALKYKRGGEDTKHALMTYVREVDADVLYVGFTGRKGPKDDALVLGTNVDYSLRAAGRTSIIVKNRDVPASSLFVVGVDGSERAQRGVDFVLRTARAEDSIVLLHVEDLTLQAHGGKAMDAPAVEARYRDTPRVSFVRVVKAMESHVADTIVDFCIDRGATYVVIGADGMGAFVRGDAQRMGSNSDKIVRTSRCTVVVMQEKHAVYATTSA